MDNLKISDNDSKALQDFLTDIKCLEEIKSRAEKFNLLDVFGIAQNEIRHSFFLKWLFDPKENHRLGDAFIRAFIASLISSEPERYKDNSFELLMMDCSDFSVQREMNNIDLFLCSEANSVAIIIENKINSREHASTGFASQLDKYRKDVEKTFKNIKTKIYVYLTPQNSSASDEETWQSFSYEEIAKLIEIILKDYGDNLAPDVKLLIQNYVEVVRRDIVENSELDKICNEIYKKHKKALDLIYAHSDLGMNQTEKIIVEVLDAMEKEKKIERDPKRRVAFHTQAMTSFLPMLTDDASSWSTRYVYNYWFNIDPDKNQVCLIFELGMKGIDDETKAKIGGFIETRNPHSKKGTDKYKRVEKSEWKHLDDNDETSNKAKIRKLVEDFLKEESTWINDCKNYIEKNH